MSFSIPLCWFNRHRPVGDRVAWDGIGYVGKCRFCGERIRRKKRRHWLREWMPAE